MNLPASRDVGTLQAICQHFKVFAMSGMSSVGFGSLKNTGKVRSHEKSASARGEQETVDRPVIGVGSCLIAPEKWKPNVASVGMVLSKSL